MNSLFNRLKYFFTHGRKMKRMMLSIVILAEVIVLLVVATYAWVETVSSIKITNAANTTGAIANDTKYTDMLIGDKTGTIDLLDYFEASGDMHLAPASLRTPPAAVLRMSSKRCWEVTVNGQSAPRGLSKTEKL